MTNITKELKEDLRKIVVDYFHEDDAVAFNRDLLEDTALGINGVGVLNENDRAQLEIEITPVKDRFHIDRTITLARKKLKTEAYLNLLTNMSEISVSHGMLNMAHEIISKINRECRIRSIKANAMIVLSDLMAIKGKWEKSIAAARNARNIYEIENSKQGLAKSNNIIGTVYGERGNLKKASRYFEQSLELAKAAGDKKLIAMLETNLGIISNIYEEYDKALEEFDAAINISLNYRYQPILAIAYIGKAEVLVSMKSYKLAALVAGKAMDFAHTIDDKMTIAEVYRLQGIICKHLETYKLAENKLKSALRLNKNLDIQLNIAECYNELASLSGVKKDIEKEKEYLMLALEYYKKIDAKDHIAEIEDRLINKAV